MGAAAAVALGAGSLFSGILGTSQTNKTNSKNAAKANELNYKMFKEQQMYNTEMYERQLRDNIKLSDPSFIRGRVEAAGFNPQLVGQGNIGTVTSAPSAQGVNPMPAVTPEYKSPLNAENVGAAIDAYNNIKLADSESAVKDATANNLRIEGQYKAAQLLAEINEKISNAKNADERTSYQRILNAYLPTLQAAEVRQQNAIASQEELRVNLTANELAMSNITLANYPTEVKLRLGQIAAQTDLMVSQKKLTEEQARTEIQKRCESMARQFNLGTQDELMRSQKAYTDRQTYNAQEMLPYEKVRATSGVYRDISSGASDLVDSAWEIYKQLKNKRGVNIPGIKRVYPMPR